MSALLAALNHYLIQKGHLPPDSPVQTLDDLERRLQAYRDPLTAQDLRTLVNLRAIRVALIHDPEQNLNNSVSAFIRAFARTHYFEYATRLIYLTEPHYHQYCWRWIAEEQAKAGLLDAALATTEQIEHSDYDSQTYSNALLVIAKEMAAHGDAHAEAVFQQAAKISFPFMTVNPPHAHPEPYFYHDLALALTDAGKIDFALEMAEKVSKFSLRAATVCYIARHLFAVNMPRARKIIDEVLHLIDEPYNRRNNHYENVSLKWQTVVLCVVAETLYPIDAEYALRLMKRAFDYLDSLDYQWSVDTHLNLLARGYAACGEATRAFQMIGLIESREVRAKTLSKVAVLLSNDNPPLAERTFEIALQLIRNNHYAVDTKHVYETIACDMTEARRLEQAIQLLIHEGCSVRDEVRDKMIDTGQIARMFSLRGAKENSGSFVHDFSECAVYIEKLQPGLWLDCVRDIARIFRWLQPGWWDILQRLQPPT